MGNLRLKPKREPFLPEADYAKFATVLREAQKAAQEHHVYYDVDKGENPNKVRKAFVHIATKENIPVTIRRERGSQSLVFLFKDPSKNHNSRMSANECRRRILKALSSSKKALQKSEIIDITGISPSTWNIRIRELMQEGKVVRHGERRDTRYSISA